MVSPLSVALSGLAVAAKRAFVSANNIVNTYSAGDGQAGSVFKPQTVKQVSVSPAGVRAVTRPITPASIPVYSPDHPAADKDGLVQMPNVSLEREIVNLKMAMISYRANLKVIETADEMAGELLDRLS